MTGLRIKEKEWHNGVDNQEVDARRRELTAMALRGVAWAVMGSPIVSGFDGEYFA